MKVIIPGNPKLGFGAIGEALRAIVDADVNRTVSSRQLTITVNKFHISRALNIKSALELYGKLPYDFNVKSKSGKRLDEWTLTVDTITAVSKGNEEA